MSIAGQIQDQIEAAVAPLRARLDDLETQVEELKSAASAPARRMSTTAVKKAQAGTATGKGSANPS